MLHEMEATIQTENASAKCRKQNKIDHQLMANIVQILIYITL